MSSTTSNLLKTKCFIDGKWTDALDAKTFEVVNPATGKVVASVPRCGRKETAAAIEAASRAFASWKRQTALQRGAVIHKWHALIMEHIEELASIMTQEQGKPLAESRGEIALGASYVPWYADECRRTYGQVIPPCGPGKRPITFKQPVGVVGIITPWNFPFSMITRKAAPALAAGCTVDIKPASLTPLTALALADLARQAGFPDGAFNVLTGSASEIGAELTGNPTVRKISFTGSTAVGKTLMAQSAATVKKVSLELGGNAPYLVFDDADLDLAAANALGCKFRNSGQTCICANRFLVQKGAHDAFVQKLVKQIETLKLGNGMDAGVTQGPLVEAKAVEHVEALVKDAVAKGAKVVVGGKRPSPNGLFFEPTVLVGVTPAMRVYREEIFGPVAPVVVFNTEEEAIAMANDTEYGLASYVFTRDLGRTWRVSEGLEYGMVGVNESALASAEVPFGGITESGQGREGGCQGILDFMETKYVLMGGIGA
jgi:succinate-semialdehyde dehydrogenase / glutarate-semialdehyde dehydrogenase